MGGQLAEQRGHSADLRAGPQQRVLFGGAPAHHRVFVPFVTSCLVTRSTEESQDRCPSEEAPVGGPDPSSNDPHPSYIQPLLTQSEG